MNTSVTAESGESATQRPDQRLGQKYRFDDPNMDLFFVAALGWGPAGGLDIARRFTSLPRSRTAMRIVGLRASVPPGSLLRRDLFLSPS